MLTILSLKINSHTKVVYHILMDDDLVYCLIKFYVNATYKCYCDSTNETSVKWSILGFCILFIIGYIGFYLWKKHS